VAYDIMHTECPKKDVYTRFIFRIIMCINLFGIPCISYFHLSAVVVNYYKTVLRYQPLPSAKSIKALTTIQLTYRWLITHACCVPANHRENLKRVKRETYNMPMDFLSDAPWKAIICSPLGQNGGASQRKCT
jgi:hypothetical protein